MPKMHQFADSSIVPHTDNPSLLWHFSPSKTCQTMMIRMALGAVLPGLPAAVGELRLGRRRVTLLAVVDALDHHLFRSLARAEVGIAEVTRGRWISVLVADFAIDAALVMDGVVKAGMFESDHRDIRVGDARAGDCQIVALTVDVAFATGALAREQRPHGLVDLLGDQATARRLGIALLAG